MKDRSTIFALSTIAGKSGVAIIRISGNSILQLLSDFKIKLPMVRQATFTKFISPLDNQVLDYGLLLYFAAPNTFTGEDLVEFHLHGSPAVISEALDILGKLPYLRPAEPGEFSKRAFLNGKLDLTSAEGLAQLIDSETSLQRKIALRQLSGELGNVYDNWRNQILNIVATLEALIDFPDEDIPQEVINIAKQQTASLSREISQHLQSANSGISIMDGIHVAIIGAPNVGKSSLLNAIANREVAIVSEYEGTTRDIIEVRLNLAGYLVTLYDTAGIRVATDVIEQEGIRRTKHKAKDCDIILYVADASRQETFNIAEYGVDKSDSVIFCINKYDLAQAKIPIKNYITTSIKQKESISHLIQMLTAIIKEKYSYNSVPIITNLRYKYHLEEALEELSQAFDEKVLDLTAFHFRRAAHAIGMITGAIDVEEILDTIFSSFCIGK